MTLLGEREGEGVDQQAVVVADHQPHEATARAPSPGRTIRATAPSGAPEPGRQRELATAGRHQRCGDGEAHGGVRGDLAEPGAVVLDDDVDAAGLLVHVDADVAAGAGGPDGVVEDAADGPAQPHGRHERLGAAADR